MELSIKFCDPLRRTTVYGQYDRFSMLVCGTRIATVVGYNTYSGFVYVQYSQRDEEINDNCMLLFLIGHQRFMALTTVSLSLNLN